MSNGAMVGTSRGLAKIKRSRQYTEEKPMKRTWKQKFRDWLNNDDYNQVSLSIVDDSEGPNLDSQNAVRFTIHHAHGGSVVQTRTYDERKDRNIENLYIIKNNEDLGEEIAKIITMEGLRS
jgi:hypothetical protein